MKPKIFSLEDLEVHIAKHGTVEDALEEGLTYDLFDTEVHYITSSAALKLAQAGPVPGEMNFDFLHELSVNVCAALLHYSGDLALNHCPTLSDAAATVLSDYKGGLSFEGIDSLSDEAIAAIAKIPGRLTLTGLRRLSNRATVALSARTGATVLNEFTEASLADWNLLRKSLGDLLTLESWDWNGPSKWDAI